MLKRRGFPKNLALWGELYDLKPLMGCFLDDAIKDNEREYVSNPTDSMNIIQLK